MPPGIGYPSMWTRPAPMTPGSVPVPAPAPLLPAEGPVALSTLPAESLPLNAVAGLAPSVSGQVPPALASSPRRLTPDAIAGLAALAASLIGGPRTTGLASGVASGLSQNEAQRARDAELALRQAQQERIAEEHRQQIAQREADRRARGTAAILELERDLAEKAPGFTDKAAYDRYVNFLGQVGTLNSEAYGVRFDPNSLRAKYPFVAPTAKQQAEKVLRDVLANPLSKDQLTATSTIRFDRDGDGIAENVPLSQLAEIANIPLVVDPNTNQPLIGKRGDKVTGAAWAELYEEKLERFITEKGREPNAGQREALKKASMREAAALQRQEDTATARREARSRLTDDLFARLVNKQPIAELRRQFGAAGLNYSAAVAEARERLYTLGWSRMTDLEREGQPSADAVMERARAILRDEGLTAAPAGSTGAGAPAPAAAPGAGGARTVTRAELKAVAQRMGITEAQAEAHAKARGLVVVP